MTNEEAAQILRTEWSINAEIFDGPFFEALELAFKALEVRPICPVDFPTEDDPYPVCSYQRPTGKWIKNEGKDTRDNFYTCSKCGRTINVICGETLADYPFCHCGAEMKEEA